MHVFVTVGTQIPFDRLIKAVDSWSFKHSEASVFCQTNLSDFEPKSVEHTPFLESNEFKKRFDWADIIVSHAGMGSIITALQYGKPIIILARRVDLGEHRNDHQMATFQRFSGFDGIYAAKDESELPELLGSISDLCGSDKKLNPYASDELVDSIKSFIWADK